MNVIIVDDEIEALHNFLDQIFLKADIHFNYQFFKADEEAILSYVSHNNIMVAFLDINMGTLNGFDLAKKISSISPKTKFVFVTGYNIKIDDVPISIKENTINIMYKPVDYASFESTIYKITNRQNILTVKMFPHFDCYINDRLVVFSSNKSKELFAYVLVNNGQSVTMESAITALWPDKDIEKAKISYRDAVWRLRQTLKDISFNCITFLRALLILNKENIVCDYYEYLEGHHIYQDEEFLVNYDWSLPYESALKTRK